MNPLQFLYDTVDILKDGKNGKISLVYDKTGKQFFIMKERDLKTAEVYLRLKEIKSSYLPEIFHALQFEGKFFLVEEFIQGKTLAEILTRNNGLDEKKTTEIFKQLCNALKILHAQKIIHRDIKPSNIMITKNGSVKLIDFSISRIEKENQETDTDFLGTREYAPPEQYGFRQTDSRSDIYSLGVTIKTLLGENYDGYLKKILTKCTELNPDNRYQSVEEILIDIDKKYFRHKAKNFSIKIGLTCAIITLNLFVGQKILDSGKMPTSEEKESVTLEENKPPQKTLSPPEKYEPKKVEWSEIKIPNTENFATSVQSTPQIVDMKTTEKKSDSRLNRVGTVTFNGKTYHAGTIEIPADIWQTWESDGENVYFPPNFSVIFNLENRDKAPFNVSVTADLNGQQDIKKSFPAINLTAGQSQNFEIPIGGMAFSNGRFEIKIWLRKNDDTPLFAFWNGENFGSNHSLKFYLLDYMKLKYRKEKKFSSVFSLNTTDKNVRFII